MDRPLFGTALAKTLWLAGDRAEAAGTYEQILTVNPNYPPALLGLGRAALVSGDTLLARRRLDQLQKLWSKADRDFSGRQELDELMQSITLGSPPRRG